MLLIYQCRRKQQDKLNEQSNRSKDLYQNLQFNTIHPLDSASAPARKSEAFQRGL